MRFRREERKVDGPVPHEDLGSAEELHAHSHAEFTKPSPAKHGRRDEVILKEDVLPASATFRL